MTKVASTWAYRIYGLRLVASQPIPGLRACRPGPADVYVDFIGARPRQRSPDSAAVLYSSASIATNGEPFLQVWKNEACEHAHLSVQYTDGTGYATFVVNREGRRVQVTWTQAMPFQEVITYFLGPVLGCILRLCHVTCLHAGAVDVGGTAIAFIGPKQAGKSTLTAFFARGGYPVLTDDVAPLVEDHGRFLILPGYPRLRLWPSTIKAMHGGPNVDDLPRVLAASEKRFVDLTMDGGPASWRFQPEPLPLSAVFVLSARCPGSAPILTPVPQAASLITLVRNTYAGYMADQTSRTGDFELLGRLSATIPLVEIQVPEGLDAVPQVCEAILGAGANMSFSR